MNQFCLAIVVASFALLSRADANEIPATWPRLDSHRATTAIVVATVAAGAALPTLDECKRKDVICLHTPFWFTADVREPLSGQVPGAPLHVATLSHYGLESFAEDPAPRLMLLKVVDGQVVMPINAWMLLSIRRDGELFLVDKGYSLPDWLPCSTPQLREPVVESDFDPAVGAKRDGDAGKFEDFSVRSHPDAWHVTNNHSFPRAGIRVTRLRELIHDLAAAGEPTTCPRSEPN